MRYILLLDFLSTHHYSTLILTHMSYLSQCLHLLHNYLLCVSLLSLQALGLLPMHPPLSCITLVLTMRPTWSLTSFLYRLSNALVLKVECDIGYHLKSETHNEVYFIPATLLSVVSHYALYVYNA